MFVRGIEVAASFTRAIHTIVRNYGSDLVQPGATTLFFVNAEGWALTCKHVAALLAEGQRLDGQRAAFEKELSERTGEKKTNRLLRELEQKYGWSKSAPFEIHNTFAGCVDRETQVHVVLHPTLDIALLRFEGGRLLCDSFPAFAARGEDLKQGKFLCRLGFPFAEFSNFRYDPESDRTSWTQEGRRASPRFPLEGMVTRHLVDPTGIVGFEMSTPGLRGQSGGPAFDMDGTIWGMQSATNHLDLDFDVDKEVVRQGKKKHAHDNAFLHVGHCIHVDRLKEFMRANGVAFATEPPPR